MNCPTWRVPRPHRPGNPAVKAPPVPATRFFDNLSYVGNEMVGCFVLDTGSGLICLDNMEPDDALYIEQGIRDLGYDPAGLKHILITHGHLDHFGNAVYFREKYGTKLWMSKTDEVWAKDVDALPEKNVKIPLAFGMDGNLEDGQIFTLGDARIECLWTPGHTPGCMSFLFTVYDEGRPHTCALWGGHRSPENSGGKPAVAGLHTQVPAAHRPTRGGRGYLHPPLHGQRRDAAGPVPDTERRGAQPLCHRPGRQPPL